VQQLQRLFSSEDALLVVMRFCDPLYMCGDNRVCLLPKEQLFFHKKTILLLWKNIVALRRRPCFQQSEGHDKMLSMMICASKRAANPVQLLLSPSVSSRGSPLLGPSAKKRLLLLTP
jgi:hypothetical protein